MREPFVARAKEVIREAFANIAKQPDDFVAVRVDSFSSGSSVGWFQVVWC
jgi:hypothetical protein